MKQIAPILLLSALVAGCSTTGTDITKNSPGLTGELAACSDPVIRGCPEVPTLGAAVESKAEAGTAMTRALLRLF
ncbi:MAG: hypothetical protein AAGA19_10410 [Pseudomonadota bacterium]